MKTTLPGLAPSEKDFQDAVLDLAHLNGWQTYHTYESRRSAAGFPDLFLVRPPRIVIAELKTARGRITSAQRAWLDLLERCPGVEVYVWRPAGFDEIARVLSRRAGDRG